jgi:cytochrome P450
MTATLEPKGSYEGVPLYTFDDSERAPILTHQERWGVLAERHPAFRSDFGPGFWVITDAQAIQAAYHDPATFSNAAIEPAEPNPKHFFIPEMLDPPEHTAWRQLLARDFSPTTVAGMTDEIRDTARRLIAEIAPQGGGDVLNLFARQFPTRIFMRKMGLPAEDLDQFLVWVEQLLHLSVDEDPGRARRMKAFSEVSDYFDEQIALRHSNPRDDLLSRAMTWTVGGEPISDTDMHAFCVLMFVAGLDTVPIAFGYSFYHLATHPDDRRAIVNDPALISTAVEEILRVYSFSQPARLATRDVVLAGCPIKAGEMAHLPLAVVNRDPSRYENPSEVDLNRKTTNHVTFGSGPHRCLGSHLARLELNIGLEEWHKVIPEYRLADGENPMQFGTLYGPESMRLSWSPEAQADRHRNGDVRR